MKSDRALAPLLLLIDAIFTVIVFNVVGHFRGIGTQLMLWPLAVPYAALVLGIYLIDGYRSRTDMISVDYTSLHIIAGLAATLVVILLTFALIRPGYELQDSRSVVLISFLLLIPLTLFPRRLLYLERLKLGSARSIIFVGDADSGASFMTECRAMKLDRTVIHAAADGSDLAAALQRLEEGRDAAVEAIVLRESNRELPLALSGALLRLYTRGIPTFPLELFHEVYWRKIPLYRLNPTWLFQEGFQVAREPVFEKLKRLSDLFLSSFVLILLLPCTAAAALAIWLEDRGPVFFAQTRIGRNQAPFRLYKLRTMRRGGGEGDPYTRAGDARITRVGRFLRASRLDEVPQLWNVLRGEMSLIGPRAEWDRLVADYQTQIPFYYYRHLVKPGITGWAQVNYPYGGNLDDTLRKLEYDLYYIRHFSFLLDASITLKTIHIMLFGRGR